MKAFQKSSESPESDKSPSAELELEVVVSSSGSNLSSSVPSPAWMNCDGGKNQCWRSKYYKRTNIYLEDHTVIMTKQLSIPMITARN
jgi:hypothetical protein